MITNTHLEEWTRSECQEQGPRTLVVLPIGALEQHGPHLPLGTDTILAEYIARAAVARVDSRIPVVVAPSFYYGSSHHHLLHGGTASITTEALYAALRDVVTTLLQSKFKSVFILNGHGGNQEIVQLVARDVALTEGIRLAAGSYFHMARPALIGSGVEDLGELPGHAGAFETSLMLAARPDLVRMSLAPSREKPAAAWPKGALYRVGAPGPFRGTAGYSDSPANADPILGATMLEVCVTAVSQALVEFHSENLDAK